MIVSRLFRDRAMAWHGRQEPLDARLQVTAPHEWMLLCGLGVVALALLGWGFFGQVDVRLSADAVLVHPGQRHAVVARASGNIAETLAQAGDAVESGQRLARVQSYQLEGGGFAQGFIISPHAGTLMLHRMVVGQPVKPDSVVGHVRVGGDDSFEVVAFIPTGQAERLEIGMEARVVLENADALGGEVASLSGLPVTPPDWLRDLGLQPPPRSHLLRVSLRDAPPPTLADGASGRLQVVLGRYAPMNLLLGRTD